MSISPLHFFPPPLASSSTSSPSAASTSTSTEEELYQALELNYHQRRLPSHKYQYDSWVKQKGLYEELRTEYLGILESSPWWSAKVAQLESVMEAVREGIKLAAKDARRLPVFALLARPHSQSLVDSLLMVAIKRDNAPAFSSPTPTTSSSSFNMTNTTLLAVLIPLVLVLSLLVIGLLALYVRRRRVGPPAADVWGWRNTLGAGRGGDMWTGGWEREKRKSSGWGWSPGAHTATSDVASEIASTPPITGRADDANTTTTYSKALPSFPAETKRTSALETKRLSTHYSPPENPLYRLASPNTLETWTVHNDASSIVSSVPFQSLDSPFHLPSLDSLASLSASPSSTNSPPRRPDHPEPTFSPSSTFAAGSSPRIVINHGTMSTQPSTETFEALTPSSSRGQVRLPSPLKKVLARSSSSPTSPSSRSVVDVVREGAHLQRWDSSRNYRNVGGGGPEVQEDTTSLSSSFPVQIKTAMRKTIPRQATLPYVLPASHSEPFSVVPKLDTSPLNIVPRSKSSLQISDINANDSPLIAAKPPRPVTTAAQIAALSFSLAEIKPSFLAYPPSSPTPSNTTITIGHVVEEPESPRSKQRRTATPRPDTGGDPCQVVKMFGLPREGENFLRGGPPSLPNSRRNSIASRASELLGLGLGGGGKSSRPSSRASTKSAFSTRSGVTAETEEEKKVTEGGGKKKRKGRKKEKEIPRPDTGKGPL